VTTVTADIWLWTGSWPRSDPTFLVLFFFFLNTTNSVDLWGDVFYPVFVCTPRFQASMWRLLLALPFTALADTCTLQNGVILGSGSLHQSKATSANDCCEQCFDYPGCIAFTFTTDTGACWLKDNVYNNTASSKSVSGTFTISRTLALRACSVAPTNQFPFCNVSLSTDERVQDLISRCLRFFSQLLSIYLSLLSSIYLLFSLSPLFFFPLLFLPLLSLVFFFLKRSSPHPHLSSHFTC